MGKDVAKAEQARRAWNAASSNSTTEMEREGIADTRSRSCWCCDDGLEDVGVKERQREESSACRNEAVVGHRLEDMKHRWADIAKVEETARYAEEWPAEASAEEMIARISRSQPFEASEPEDRRP